MTPNIKISIGIIIALITAFSVLIIMEKTQGNLTSEQFFSSDFSNQRTVFLLGSSQVGQLNATQVNNRILSDETIAVYNLAMANDTPIKRVNELEQIISAKPELVFYGISYRDFSFPYQEKPMLPRPQQIISPELHSNFNDIAPSNPNLLTISILKNLFFENPDGYVTIPKTPFTVYNLVEETTPHSKISKVNLHLLEWDDLEIQDQNIWAIEKIISKLHTQKIKIVLFTTPLHEYYLESLSDYQKNNFSLLQNDLIDKYGLKIYKFEEKYKKDNVWNNIDHISLYKNSTSYNEDVAKMIITEIGK